MAFNIDKINFDSYGHLIILSSSSHYRKLTAPTVLQKICG